MKIQKSLLAMNQVKIKIELNQFLKIMISQMEINKKIKN